LLLVASFISHSQTEEFECAFNNNEEMNFNSSETFSNSTDPAVLYAKEPIVMNVYFWQVNDRNGVFGNSNQGQEDITEEEVLSAIANLNIYYNEYNLFFKYKGLGQFNSPEVVYVEEFYNNPGGNPYCVQVLDSNGDPIEDLTGFTEIENLCEMEQLTNFADSEGYMPEEYINIYVPFHSFAYGGEYTNPKIIIDKRGFTTMGIIHEMGHVFALKHTFFEFRDPNLGNPLSQDYEDCEHVTRISSDSNYNADTNGDEITDTAAVPDFKNEEYYLLLDQGFPTAGYDRFKYINNCIYNGTNRDCQDNDFDILPSDVTNVMSYSGLCKETLTIGQAIRMHEIVAYFEDHNHPNYETRRAELSDLFEPYKGEYYTAGPLPVGYQEPLFQPGFKYQFMECEGEYSSPADYGETFYYNVNNVISSFNNDETHYENITHPNHTAIHIKHAYGDFLDQPEKCYDNFNKAPSGGSITKFNDNVFNTNVTITAQDSTGINNENLIESLEPGLYNIKKTYDDGSTQETIIFKENN